MKTVVFAIVFSLCVGAWLIRSGNEEGGAFAANPENPAPGAQRESVPSDRGTSESRRMQLAEREAALALKEQELQKLSASVDGQIRELNATRKAMEGTLTARKKAENERYKRMLKVYKALKPDEAARLIDKLDDDIAIEMLNQMDQKTAVKLIPYLNQPRVLKWTKDTLRGK